MIFDEYSGVSNVIYDPEGIRADSIFDRKNYIPIMMDISFTLLFYLFLFLLLPR